MNTTFGALSNVNQQISSLLKIFQNQGINPSDYSTSTFTINPVYNYTNGVSLLVGEKATQMFTVKIKNVTNGALAVGNLITAASKIDGIIVESVNFDQSDRTFGTQKARSAAFTAARSKADQYANLTGLTLQRLKKIEAIDYGTFTPYYVTGSTFSSNLNLLVPSRNVTISANVELWYSI
jgi:uncharacterized protein YggE